MALMVRRAVFGAARRCPSMVLTEGSCPGPSGYRWGIAGPWPTPGRGCRLKDQGRPGKPAAAPRTSRATSLRHREDQVPWSAPSWSGLAVHGAAPAPGRPGSLKTRPAVTRDPGPIGAEARIGLAQGEELRPTGPASCTARSDRSCPDGSGPATGAANPSFFRTHGRPRSPITANQLHLPSRPCRWGKRHRVVRAGDAADELP